MISVGARVTARIGRICPDVPVLIADEFRETSAVSYVPYLGVMEAWIVGVLDVIYPAAPEVRRRVFDGDLEHAVLAGCGDALDCGRRVRISVRVRVRLLDYRPYSLLDVVEGLVEFGPELRDVAYKCEVPDSQVAHAARNSISGMSYFL